MRWLRSLLAWLADPSRRFVPLFLLYLAGLTILSGRIPQESITALLRATAWLDYRLLRLFSDGARLDGILVSLDGFTVQVISECTGLFEAVILVSAVLAYRASWRERLLGAVLGTGLLYLVNVIRIAFLVVLGRHLPGLFDFAHVYLWQTLMVAYITAIWLAWIHYGVSHEGIRHEADPALHA